MKILVTGATGFTGRFFQIAAESIGHQVIGLVTDLTDQASVQEAVLRIAPEAVVHLAAISFVGHADEAAFYRVNVLGTMNLLSALSSLPHIPKKVLLASSANVYGKCNASPIAEMQEPEPVNHYAMSKLAMEHMARTFLDRLPIVYSRPFNYTGLGQATNFLIPKLVDHFVRRADVIELGNLNVEREFNDVRMVCAAYLALLDKGVAGQIYNVCTSQSYTLRYIIELLSEMTGHTMDVRVNPAFVRANEVHRLYGCPIKLLTCTGSLPQFSLHDTLRWMLDVI
jgi:nucleoside-diphosphate-sugar epimerase